MATVRPSVILNLCRKDAVATTSVSQREVEVLPSAETHGRVVARSGMSLSSASDGEAKWRLYVYDSSILRVARPVGRGSSTGSEELWKCHGACGQENALMMGSGSGDSVRNGSASIGKARQAKMSPVFCHVTNT